MVSDELTRLLAELRPRLHRYCARMVGSPFEGEDIVQEALADAVESHPFAGEIEHPEAWLFRIAHNRALDALRRRRRHGLTESDEVLLDLQDVGAAADSHVAATASLATLLHLPTIQRSTVVLADVLGHSLLETADILNVSLPAVKSALHRARERLRDLVETEERPQPILDPADLARLSAYADRFNAHDFDALRGLLSEEVRLDLVDRARLAGRKDVSIYFTRYAQHPSYHITVGWAHGRPVLLVRDPTMATTDFAYVVLLDWDGDRIAAIRDFHYARYVMDTVTAVSL